jgi:hypothetical protein
MGAIGLSGRDLAYVTRTHGPVGEELQFGSSACHPMHSALMQLLTSALYECLPSLSIQPLFPAMWHP